MSKNNLKPYLIFFLIWIIFSYPFFFKGRIPAPLDFLVDFYSPWEQYYNLPVKNASLSDVVSQIIPWKLFNAQELKAGRIPVWNPYNLGGTPQLGNWQSGVFYPTTLLFLILPDMTAWSLHVLLQPLLAGIFMLLFLRSLSISQIASLMGAVVFAYGGFMTSWFEWGTLGHAILWLPLALYGIKKTRNRKQETLLTIFALTMSLLAGHPQTSIYVMLTVVGYYLYININRVSTVSLFLVSCSLFLLPLLLASPQIFPSIQVYMESAKSLIDGSSWAKSFLIKPENLLTMFAPDFFGNPVTRNNWGSFSYVEMQGYAGIATILLSLFAVMSIKRPGPPAGGLGLIKFFILLIVIALIFAVDNPISRLLINLKIPIISGSSPSRLMGIVDFSLAVLAASGLDIISKIDKKRLLKYMAAVLIVFSAVFAGMWIWTFVFVNPNALVTRRNLIFPSGIFMLFSAVLGGLMIIKKINIVSNKRLPLILASCFLFLTIFDLFRFHHKFTPFSLKEYWYPDVPVLSEIAKRTGRVFGGFEGNMNIQYKIKTIEGYDPLINKNIIEMTFTPEELSKKNRIVSPNFPKGEPETIEFLNKMGVKWIVDYAVPGNGPWDLRLWKYGDQFRIDWKDASYQILYNTKAVEEEFEPAIQMKNSQYMLLKLGFIASLAACSGILFGYKKYVK